MQDRLDGAKPASERNRLGQFATPLQLASEIVAAALALLPAREKIRFLDPAFGTGPFYSALLQTAPGRLQTAAGFEIDPAYGKEVQRLWRATPLRLTIGDFTKIAPPADDSARYNMVVCNPPYVRHHHLSQGQKRELRAAVVQRTRFELSGLSGLYAYFLILSKAWMARGGVGAWLIASEFLDVNYGRQVKRFLLEEVTVERIHCFDPKEVQFGDALVSSTVVLLRNTPPLQDHRIELSFGGSLGCPKVSSVFRAEELRRLEKWSAAA